MPAKNVLALFATVLHAVLPLGCSDDAACEPNAGRACIGKGDCDGTQRCASDGSGYGACACADRVVPSKVGQPCLRDAECAADETCFDGDEESFLGGLPAVAVCSLRCEHDPRVCERRDPPSTCVVTDDRGTEDTSDDRAHCLEACRIGEASAQKCRGDEGLVCASVDSLAKGTRMRAMAAAPSEDGVCRPLCTRDVDCSPEVCNLRTGACDTRGERGDAFGAECDPASDDPTCAGVCVEVDGAAFCSHRCWFGSADDCGGEGLAAPAGLCRFPEQASGRIGDVGFCALLCDEEADCAHPDLSCDPFDAELSGIVGRAGVCEPLER